MNKPDAHPLDEVWSPEPTPIPVELGPWTFELRGDEIANLSFDSSPVVRSVRAVARDRDWNTVPTTVQGFEPREHGYRLRLGMSGFGADVGATIDITQTIDALAFSLEATAHADFETNRIGLVVLHPPDVAGTPLTVGTSDGDNRTTFPATVSPHQPAFDIRSLSWEHDGVHTRADFAGDVFEMEDQRNWTDASFKTYSRPLALPFPYTIHDGETVTQSVFFSSERVRPRPARTAAAAVELTRARRPVPDVTVGASTGPDAAVQSGQSSQVPAGVLTVLVELDIRTPSWRAALDRAATEAGGLPLDIRIIADDPDSVRTAVVVVAESGARVSRLGVYSGTSSVTEFPLWTALTDAAHRLLPDVPLVGGARSHFTELNREHGRLPDSIPELTFSLTPQMHATERAQLIESIPMQAVVVRSAGQIARGRPLHIGPITLRSRYNAVATSAADHDAPSDLSRGYGAELTTGATDPRQAANALEAWTVASFAAIASATDHANVASVSYFETFGSRGLGDDNGPYPVARAVAALADLGGGELLRPASLPPGIWCIGSRKPDGSWQALLTNLRTTATTVAVTIDGDATSLEITPYSVVRLERAVASTDAPPGTNHITEREKTS